MLRSIISNKIKLMKQNYKIHTLIIMNCHLGDTLMGIVLTS